MGFGKFIKKAVGVALPVVGAILGGPVGAAIGSAIAGKVTTGSWKGWARNALIGGATAYLGGAVAGKGWNPLTQSQNAWNSAKSAMQSWGGANAGARSANVGNSGMTTARASGVDGAINSGTNSATAAQSGSGTLQSMGSGQATVMGQPSSQGIVNSALSGSNGGWGAAAKSGLSTAADLVKAYGPKAYNIVNQGMKLYSAMEAEEAYAQLAAQMEQGGQLNQYAIDALMQMEKNPEVYLNSPEVKAARDRAMEIVKRQAAAKGETYSTNAINDYITQSLLVDTNAMANRRNYLQGMAQNPSMSLAQMQVAQGQHDISQQKQGALTELGAEVFGSDNMKTYDKGLIKIGA